MHDAEIGNRSVSVVRTEGKMHMIVRGPRCDSDFTVLTNALLRDDRLSYRATGLLAALLSHPPGWSVSSTRLMRDGKEGRDAIRTALRELEDCGYLVRDTVRNDDGTFAVTTIVYEVPVDPPAPENPAPDSQAPIKELKKKELEPDSLRSSGHSDRKSLVIETDDINDICRAFWDLHKEQRNGLTPVMTWNQLRAVVKSARRADCSPDEIVAALMAHDRTKATGASIVAKVAEARRRASEAPAGPAIHPGAITAWKAVCGAYSRRVNGVPGAAVFENVVDRASTLQVFEILLRPGFGMTLSEVVARACIFFKHAGLRTPTIDDLVDPQMPFSGPRHNIELDQVADMSWKNGMF